MVLLLYSHLAYACKHFPKLLYFCYTNASNMKKIAIGIGVVVLVTAGGLGWAYLMNSREATKQNEEAKATSVPKSQASSSKSDDAKSTNKGTYVIYTDDIIAATAGTKILFFHAPWCPQCRALHTDINASKIPDGVTIIKVDYDSHQDLRQKYGVTLQTTFVRVDDDGELIEKYVAYNEPTFDSVKENLLEESDE